MCWCIEQGEAGKSRDKHGEAGMSTEEQGEGRKRRNRGKTLECRYIMNFKAKHIPRDIYIVDKSERSYESVHS